MRGSRVIIGCGPRRPGRPAFLEELRRLLPPPKGKEGEILKFKEATGMTCSGPRHDLICGRESEEISDVPRDIKVAIMDLDPRTLMGGRFSV